jgi:CDP-diacylglycerol--glycerol-3-phosphate 3-phosphatidyltransferase
LIWRRLKPAIPNALTLARFALTAVLVVVLSLVPADREGLARACLVAAGLFVVAACTDALDGFLARRWNVVSTFGRVMDPVADKVLVIGALILLAGPAFRVEGQGQPYQISGVEGWMVVLVLARELVVTSIRAVLESQGVKFGADAAGKAKMVLQSVVTPLILILIGVTWPEQGTWSRWVVLAAVWAMLAATILSGLPYLVRAARTGRLAGE